MELLALRYTELNNRFSLAGVKAPCMKRVQAAVPTTAVPTKSSRPWGRFMIFGQAGYPLKG